ncbi:MAG: DUF4349 domain-containing protein [Chloroflexi bacterium]|nr:DUF4349 domain-containing protein [Chloroflexota bacterium]
MKNTLLKMVGVLLLAALALSACGAAATPSYMPGPAAESRAADGSTTTAGAPNSKALPSNAPAQAPAPGQPSTGSAAVSDRLIIKTATIALIVKNTEQAFDSIKTQTAAFGGFVSDSSTVRIDKDRVRITATVRVPADKYDEAIKAFKKDVIRVNNEKLGGQDVTEEYTDLNARLRNLEATEKELLALMTTVRERMQKAEDILAVQREINNVRGQIEQLKARIQFLDRSVSLATITVSLDSETPEAPVTQEGWDPLRVARDALRGLVSTMQGLVNLAIYLLIFVAPVLLVIFLPLYGLWRLWRRSRKPKAPKA